jgi:hypothetical protein
VQQGLLVIVAVEACGSTAGEVEVVEELMEENCLVQGVVEGNVLCVVGQVTAPCWATAGPVIEKPRCGRRGLVQ